MNAFNALSNLIATAIAKPEAARLPEVITWERINYVRSMAALQVFTAMVVNLAIILCIVATTAMAFRLHKTALTCMALIGVAVFWLPFGYSNAFGITLFAVAVMGMVRALAARKVPQSIN